MPIALSAQPYGHRDRQIADVRDRHRERTLQSDRGSSRLGAPVQRDRRLPRARTTDLDLSPTDSANSETEHFRDGFLRGPPTGEMQDVRAAVHLLPLRVYAIEKPPWMLLEDIPNAHGLNDVDAHFRTHTERTRRVSAAGVARGSGVRASR